MKSLVQKNIPTSARLGAAAYFIWGLLHLQAAFKVFELGVAVQPGMVQGRLFQSAWNLGFFAVVSIVVAILGNWRNSRLGFWLNLVTVSVTDIGFIIFVLAPGYLPLGIGILGPIFWGIGVTLTYSAKRIST